MALNATVGPKCPSPMVATSNGIFQGNIPLDFALPLAILQMCLVISVTRSLAFLLRPLRQPRVIAEIIGGILLGPSALGRNKSYMQAIFPAKSITVLDTLANLGLLLFLFLTGLELDLKSLRQTGKKALGVAIAGIALPFTLGVGSSFVLKQTISKGVHGSAFLVFMGVALSITAFPVLARILAELKLLTTNVGRMALSAAAVNDIAAWILLALAIALSGSGNSPLVSLWVLLSACVLVICLVLVVPPIFKLMASKCHDGEPVKETFICATLVTVLAAGLLTDAIGIHAMFGAFVVGVLMPKEGPFAGALIAKIEDLVSALFLPLYFVSSGLKTNIATIQGLQSWLLLVLVIFTACFGKIVGTVLVSLLCKVPLREALAIGFLMNAKGLVELIVLNIGKDRKVLNDQTFAIMVLMAVFTTFITTPMVAAVYKPARRRKSDNYKHKTIQRKISDAQLRILACFHSSRNIPSMINLMEASRGTENRALSVFALHLMELSERSSAILMVHKSKKKGLPTWSKGLQSNSDQIVVAFETFQQLSRVTIRPMTSISAMADMHEDICATASKKRAAIIILPFHKHQRLDGSLETTHAEFRSVNRRVLEHAPCSVGILVDRGLGGTTHVSASNVSYLIAVFFFGGCDDRECLAYGMRMAEHPGISLTVIHFIIKPGTDNKITAAGVEENHVTKSVSLDDEVLFEFRRGAANNDSIQYTERFIKNTNDAIAVIRGMSHCNLYLVGRRTDCGVALPSRKNDCAELGPVGSLLASSDFSTTASVLVIQQYDTEVSLNLGSEVGEDSRYKDSESDST